MKFERFSDEKKGEHKLKFTDMSGPLNFARDPAIVLLQPAVNRQPGLPPGGFVEQIFI